MDSEDKQPNQVPFWLLVAFALDLIHVATSDLWKLWLEIVRAMLGQ
jgi:hypothetical protein